MRVAPKTKTRKPLRERAWFGKRRFADIPALDHIDDAEYAAQDVELDAPDWRCNVVTSLLPNGKHAVTLDLDFPAKLLESRTEGHHHLYLDPGHELTWKQYKKLLKVMGECGLLEQGYVDASIAKGFTALRKPEGVRVNGTSVDFYAAL